MARLDRLLERLPAYAGRMLAGLVGATLLAGFAVYDVGAGRSRLEVDASADRLLPRDDESRRFYEHARTVFGSDETLLLAVADEDVFAPEVLRRIARMTERIEALDGVHHVLSLTNALDVRIFEDDLEIAPFVRDIPEDAEGREILRQRVLGNPLYAGSLVSKDTRATALMSTCSTCRTASISRADSAPRSSASPTRSAGTATSG